MHSSRIPGALITMVFMGLLAVAPLGCSSDDPSFCSPGSGVPASGDAEYPPAMPADFCVQKATDHGIQLSWTPNTESDLAGYRVYVYNPSPYRSNSYTCPHGITLIDPGRTTYLYQKGDLLGTHYFKMTAVDLDGNESLPTGPYEFGYEGDNGREYEENTLEGEGSQQWGPASGYGEDWNPGRSNAEINGGKSG